MCLPIYFLPESFTLYLTAFCCPCSPPASKAFLSAPAAHPVAQHRVHEGGDQFLSLRLGEEQWGEVGDHNRIPWKAETTGAEKIPFESQSTELAYPLSWGREMNKPLNPILEEPLGLWGDRAINK